MIKNKKVFYIIGAVLLGFYAGEDEKILNFPFRVNVLLYANKDFNFLQMLEIRFGLEDKIDVSPYLNVSFDSNQMEQIRLGLKANLDVSKYAKQKYPWQEMKKIRLKLKKESRL